MNQNRWESESQPGEPDAENEEFPKNRTKWKVKLKDSFSAEKAINKLVKFFPSLGPASDSEGEKQAKEKEIEKRLNKAQEAGDIAAFMRYADTVGLDENLEPKEQPIVNEPTDKVNASDEPMEVEPSKRQPIVEVTPTGSDPVDNLAKKTSNVVPSALKGFEGLVEFKSKETHSPSTLLSLT